MPAPVPDQLQSALGAAYTLERELGRGGMATVYLARDAKHGRAVALKVLHPDLAASLGPDRFRREIGFAATLSHPHILTVLDSGETNDGQLWFTMPYVEGETLRDRLERERQLPVDDALRITREVAGALTHAHEHGVIHRDIKPENILLTLHGDALLADFGIARALTASDPSAQRGAATLTQTGLAVGTPQYMSPEQASGDRDLTPRSDIYSLGAVLYEMLAGEPPFTGPTQQAVIAKMLSSDAPSVRQSRPAVPEGVDAALMRALAPVPADRWASVADFSKALDAAERTALTSAAVQSGKRRVPATALALGLGFLIGIGLLFAWRSKNTADTSGASMTAVRLAVLPFENVGDSSDSYFAEGMTDAVREKLTSLPGLAVIGSASSRQYRNTTKTPQQIGQELGVRYLLEGRVQWDKSTGGASRVRVSPELVDVGSAADKWAAPFDAPLTDVFQVQSDIASKVAEQLQIALTPVAERTLATAPTTSLEAYDSYLRGLAIVSKRGNSSIVVRQSTNAFRDAIQRDSSFALAWAQLSISLSTRYSNGIPSAAIADSARVAAERALTLAPDLAASHAAMGTYFLNVRKEFQKAYEQYAAGLARNPHDVVLLRRIGSSELTLGRLADAERHAQQAVNLDPRDAPAGGFLGLVQRFRREYPAARAVHDRALAIEPANATFVEGRAMVSLEQGDLPGARAIVARALQSGADTFDLALYLANYYDLGWILDSAQERMLLRARPSDFEGDTATWAVVLAHQYTYRHEPQRARAYADSGLSNARAQARVLGDDQRLLNLGLLLAYLGHAKEAIDAGKRAVALPYVAMDGINGPYDHQLLARIYMLLGERDKAIDELAYVISRPSRLSPAWLRIDPTWNALREEPRFVRLTQGP